MQITLLNWDTYLETNNCDLASFTDHKKSPLPILKVLYKVILPDEQSQKNAQVWRRKMSPTAIFFFDEECSDLTETLQKSTQVFPPSKRQFAGQNVGFFYLISKE